jgi:hypothetical protein
LVSSLWKEENRRFSGMLPESLKHVEHTEKLARYASNACKSRLSKLSGRSAPELKYAPFALGLAFCGQT